MAVSIFAMPIESKAATYDAGELQLGATVTNTLNIESNTSKDSAIKYTVNIPSDGRIILEFFADRSDLNFSFNTISGSNILYDRTLDKNKAHTYSANLKQGTYELFCWHNCLWTRDNIGFRVNASFESAGKSFTYVNDMISDVKDQPAIRYGSRVNGFFTWDDMDEYYRVSIPTNGQVDLAVINDSVGGDLTYCLKKTDGKEITPKDEWSSKQEVRQGNKKTSIYTLEKGNYYLYFTSRYTGKYHFDMKFSLAKPASLKVKNVAGKKIKVSGKKSGTISGYEVRYRVVGTSKWKTIKVKGNKDFNCTIKGLKKNKTYEVQTRVSAKVDGVTKHSGWSSKKKVKIKK